MRQPSSPLSFGTRAFPPRRRLPWALLLLCLLTAVAGCLGSQRDPLLIKEYILEYPAPEPAAGDRLPAFLQVERLSAAQYLAGRQMVYKPLGNERGIYNYHRWLVTPAAMAGDLLRRDLAAAGSFSAVLGSDGGGEPRFILQGGVEEFMEVDGPGDWQALCVIGLTLLDSAEPELPQRVLWQKTYRAQRPMSEKSPLGLARGLSACLEEISGRVRKDVTDAAARRLKEDPAPPAGS